MDGGQELVVIPMISEEEAEEHSANVPQDGLIIAFFISYFIIVAWYAWGSAVLACRSSSTSTRTSTSSSSSVV
jgi:hypothetical protein